MRGADPLVEDDKGRNPLLYAKDKIKDENDEWLRSVVGVLEDTMDVNKGVLQRIRGAFVLDQPVYKIRRSRKTMFGYFGMMIVSQLLL